MVNLSNFAMPSHQFALGILDKIHAFLLDAQQ